jgi:hypothetical protein
MWLSMYGFRIHRPAAAHIRPRVIWKIATQPAAEQTSLLGEADCEDACLSDIRRQHIVAALRTAQDTGMIADGQLGN